jgi:hypothetical protein
MKAVRVVTAVLIIATLIDWVRQGETFSILESLPLIGGYRPGIYDVGAAVMILIAFWGIERLARRQHGHESDRGGNEEGIETIDMRSNDVE